MRVIGGTAKNKKLISGYDTVRPTSDRIKETLFNVLENIQGTYFLDLFSGTGNIGIEAISRGAASVCFVEKSFNLCKTIKENLRLTGFEQKGRVFKREVNKNLFSFFKNRCFVFDIIFADPPYEKGTVRKIFDIIDFDIVPKDGIFVLQHSVREKVNNRAKREIQIGDTLLSFYERNT